MAENTPTDPTPVPTPNPPTDEPSDAAKQTLKALMHETLDEWAEKNKPAPSRTNRPRNLLNDILGYGKE